MPASTSSGASASLAHARAWIETMAAHFADGVRSSLAHARAWIETDARLQRPEYLGGRSLTRGRGLKLFRHFGLLRSRLSLAHARAWIETMDRHLAPPAALVARSRAGVD